jgi:hypothetical protein
VKPGLLLYDATAYNPSLDEYYGVLCMHNHRNVGSRTVIAIGLFVSALIEEKIKFSSYIRKFRMEQLQSHI